MHVCEFDADIIRESPMRSWREFVYIHCRAAPTTFIVIIIFNGARLYKLVVICHAERDFISVKAVEMCIFLFIFSS